MDRKNRRENHKREIRRLIIDESIRLISNDGHEQFTIRKLAAAIDYSPRTIYIYFKNKADILDEIAEFAFAETLKQIPAEGIPADIVFFRKMLDRHLRNAVSRPNLYRAVISRTSGNPDKMLQSEKQLLLNLSRLILKLRKEDSDPLLTAELILAELRSAAVLLITKTENNDGPDIDEYISAAIKLILEGMK